VFIVWLLLASGFFWTLTYLLIIARGFLDRTYGMPFVALCANLSWEFIFWFVLDVVILFQFIKYWRSDYPANLSLKFFYPLFALTLVGSFCTVLFVSLEFKDWEGKYAAFGQNLLMSILFVAMLVRRNSLAGQSFYIALFKMLGTLLPSLGFLIVNPRSLLFDFLYVGIFLFDAIYLIAVYRKYKELGIHPWTDVIRRETRVRCQRIDA